MNVFRGTTQGLHLSSCVYFLAYLPIPLSLQLYLTCATWMTVGKILWLQESWCLCTTSTSSMQHWVKLYPPAVATRKALCNEFSGACRGACLETYAVLFPRAIKYNLSFPFNLSLCSVGHVKAKCHAFATRSCWKECPWWRFTLIKCEMIGRELHKQALSLCFSLGATNVGDPSKKSMVQLCAHSVSLATDSTATGLSICWHLSLYGEMRPSFTSTWVCATCSELCILHFETCLVKSASRLVIKRLGCPITLHSLTFDLSL